MWSPRFYLALAILTMNRVHAQYSTYVPVAGPPQYPTAPTPRGRTPPAYLVPTRSEYLVRSSPPSTRQGSIGAGDLPEDPLQFMLQPRRDQTVGYTGRNVKLPCEPRGYPPPKVWWYKNNSSIDIRDRTKYMVLKLGSLLIKDLKKSDAGEYYCQAYKVPPALLMKVEAKLVVKQDLMLLYGKILKCWVKDTDHNIKIFPIAPLITPTRQTPFLNENPASPSATFPSETIHISSAPPLGPTNNSGSLYLIAGVSVAGVVLLTCCVLVVVLFRRRRTPPLAASGAGYMVPAELTSRPPPFVPQWPPAVRPTSYLAVLPDHPKVPMQVLRVPGAKGPQVPGSFRPARYSTSPLREDEEPVYEEIEERTYMNRPPPPANK